ncbi:MAG: hypothetical protein IKY94_05685 [Lachnospiraceae bacterium]|nr:hypothetical protein [Lachnospiraceae bacterium]
MSVEYQENYYDYIYELEGYINEVLRERTSLDMTMAEVISKAEGTDLMKFKFGAETPKEEKESAIVESSKIVSIVNVKKRNII